MRDKICSAAEAVAMIRPGATVVTSGFVGVGTPEALIAALERRFLETGEPRDLTLVFSAAPGDNKSKGLNRLAHDRLVKRLIGGHFGLVQKLTQLAISGKCEAYNLPLGVMSHLYREIAGGRPRLFSKVGLGTFIDPRNGGGKMNCKTTEDLVELREFGGEEWLFYKTFPIDRLSARQDGRSIRNVTMEKEAATLDNLQLAMAGKASGVSSSCRSSASSPPARCTRVTSKSPATWSITSSWPSRKITCRPMGPITTAPSPANSVRRRTAPAPWKT
ncbi:CoA-transferase [Rhizobium ruizarguesonis]|uniref:CoA-transferase n=1 Tax=Rhizobium ruizarguesonis TaxID=2081791 RepID=UPI001FE0BF37|nr:CoA-transferase [Rhizobium ruizarguesonis]